jgi:hypothetical protein
MTTTSLRSTTSIVPTMLLLMIFTLLLSVSAVAGTIGSGNKIRIAAGSSLQGRQSLEKKKLGTVEGDTGLPTTRRNGRDTVRRSLEEGRGGGDDAEDSAMCLADVLECPGGTFLERMPENGCEFGECPNVSENEIVNADGVSTSDGEIQKTLLADDETDFSVEIDDEAEIEEGAKGGGVIEADEDDGNLKEEVISVSTIHETNALGTVGQEMESDKESEEEYQLPEESDKEDQLPSSALEPSSAEEAESGGKGGAKDEESSPSSTSSYYTNNNHHRSAWVAHGLMGFSVFGLLVPIAMSSALFRDFIPYGWIYLHVGINLLSFAVIFFAVGIAFVAMNGMIAVEGGHHMDERHHVAGLLLLLLISSQTANGFLRPPREFITNDENDATPGAVFRPNANDRGIRPRMLWYSVHVISGLFIFGLGAYQVQSGLGLYAIRFGTTDWGSAYIMYICFLAGAIIAGKSWMVRKEQKEMKTLHKLSSPELQMHQGIGSRKLEYGAEDLTVAQWETV